MLARLASFRSDVFVCCVCLKGGDCMCVTERDGERESVCVCARERLREIVCVCKKEREREGVREP